MSKQNSLSDIDLNKIPRFSLEGQNFECRVYLGDIVKDINEIDIKSDVYDGDSLHIVIIYNNIPHKFNIRLLGIDSPEMRPKWNQNGIRISDNIHKFEKKCALVSRNALKLLLFKKKMYVEFGKNDKFGGRILAKLYFINKNSQRYDVSEWMITNNFAKKYDGGKKKTNKNFRDDLPTIESLFYNL